MPRAVRRPWNSRARTRVHARLGQPLNEWLLDPKKKLDIDALDRLDSPPTSWPDAKPKLKYLKSAARALSSVNESAIAAALSLLEPFLRRARAELRRQGVVSFDELLLRARNLLRDHVSVRTALKRRFDAFLIDEFQDTDPLQSEIVVYLAESLEAASATWENAELGAGRLFVVGDPKQSIYRFRWRRHRRVRVGDEAGDGPKTDCSRCCRQTIGASRPSWNL